MSNVKIFVAAALLLTGVAMLVVWANKRFSPLGPEHAAAQALLAEQKVAEAAAIYARLAGKGDAAAINNLAVLKYRGQGIEKDGEEAARLFKQAAALGLARAKLNIALATTYGCPLGGLQSNRRRSELLQAMKPDADPLVASFLADCVARARDSRPVADGADDPGGRLLELAKSAAKSDDPDDYLHLGFKLTAVASAASNGDHASRAALGQVPALANAAMGLFEAAEKSGRVAALQGYSEVAKLGADLGHSALASRIKSKSEQEWLHEAAGRGHTVSACTLARRSIRGWIDEMNKSAPKPPSREDIVRFQSLTEICRRTPIPPGYAYREGKKYKDVHAAELAYDSRFDRWMKDDVFVIAAPNYPNFEHDYLRADETRGLLGLLARRGIELATSNAPTARR